MAELRLEVREFKDPTAWRWVLTDAAGAFIADHEVRLDAGCSQYDAFTNLPFHLSLHVAPDAGADGKARAVREVGAWVGESVFGPIAAELAKQRPTTVRVAVPEEARALLFLPFELGHANGKPLAVQDVTLVMQFGPEASSAPRDGVGNGVPNDGRLRVLGLFSLPEGGQALNLRRERHSLVQLIRSIAADGKAADVRVLQYGVTRRALRDALEEAEGWDVIHISGHGAPGELLLEDARGKPDRVTADELADMLDLARERVSLVTVSACWSAAITAAEQRRLLQLPVPNTQADVPHGDSPRTDSPDGSNLDGKSLNGNFPNGSSSGERSPDGGVAAGDLATSLAERLGCAVLAMRFPVDDNFAIALSSNLYRLLVGKGQPLPRAVGITLKQLAESNRWPALSLVTPALFGTRAAGLTLRAPERTSPEEYDPANQRMVGFPSQPERFVGRVGVMTRASAALAPDSGIPGVLLHGMPGGGKTACALELAYTHEHAFQHLIWYKAPDEGMDIRSALTNFTLTLERDLPRFQMAHLLADPAKLTTFLPKLTKLAQDRRFLIVVDNIESLLTADGHWRDAQWSQIITALSAHNARARRNLTTRRLPAAVSGLENVSVGG